MTTVATTGKSILDTIERVKAEAGATIAQVIVLVDRLEGARAVLASHGLRSVFTRRDFHLTSAA